MNYITKYVQHYMGYGFMLLSIYLHILSKIILQNNKHTLTHLCVLNTISIHSHTHINIHTYTHTQPKLFTPLHQNHTHTHNSTTPTHTQHT